MKYDLGKLTHENGNLYKESHGKMVIVEKYQKMAYIIEKDETKKANLYQSRFIISILFALVIGFYISWVGAVIVGLILAAIMEWVYRNSFLKSQVSTEYYELPEKPKKEEILAKAGIKENILRILCSLALPVLLVINDYGQIVINQKGWTFDNICLVIFSVIASVYALYIAYKCALAIKINKEGK